MNDSLSKISPSHIQLFSLLLIPIPWGKCKGPTCNFKSRTNPCCPRPSEDFHEARNCPCRHV